MISNGFQIGIVGDLIQVAEARANGPNQIRCTALRLVELALGYLVYYMALSVWLGGWRKGWT